MPNYDFTCQSCGHEFLAETLFLRMLEGIHPRDAAIVIAMKDKKLQEQYPALSKELVKAVWPNLILS